MCHSLVIRMQPYAVYIIWKTYTQQINKDKDKHCTSIMLKSLTGYTNYWYGLTHVLIIINIFDDGPFTYHDYLLYFIYQEK